MGILITSVNLGDVVIQGGRGIPTHVATRGTLYVDFDTGIEYINKDGIILWGAQTDTVLLSGFTDVYVTGGTYNNTTGTATFTNNTGGTFNVTGFFTGGTFSGSVIFTSGITANTIFTNSITANTAFISGLTVNTALISALTATTIVTNALTARTAVISALTATSIVTNTLTARTAVISALTATSIVTNGLTAATISATTYLGLPLDIRVTGGTITTGSTTFTNNTGGTFTVTGLSTDNILNLSTVTGFTASDALNQTTIWKGNWVPTTYLRNQQVLDNSFLAIANKTTEDRPEPQAIGTPDYVYSGTISATSVSAKQVIFGNRYQFNQHIFLEGWRINTVAGNNYSVYLVESPTTLPIITQIIQYTAQNSGWIPLNISKTIIASGSTYDLVVTVSEPDPTPTTFTGNWNYQKPTNPSNPSSGQITHANKALGTLRIHKIDNDLNNRESELSGLSIGDIITITTTRWAIQSSTDSGTYFEYSISPAIQLSTTGVKNFTFETVTSTPITYPFDPNFWTNNPPLNITTQGLLGIDSTYFSIVPNGTAYGVDILVREILPSPDWDLQAFTNVVSSSGGDDIYTVSGNMVGNSAVFNYNVGGGYTVSGIVNTATTLTINGVTKTLNQNNEWLTLQGNTGILNFSSGLTLNNSTAGTINIAAMYGYIVDNETNPAIPTYTYINYSGSPTSGVTVSTRNSGIASYVLLNLSGTPIFQNTFPTSAQRKQNIWLGKIAHPVSGAITTVINEPDFLTSPQSQVADLFQAINYINDGVYPYASGTNLSFNITNGNIHGNGINLHNSKLIPNEIQMGPISTGTSFVYRTQTGGTMTATTSILPSFYDVGGVLTAVGGGSQTSTVQWIFCVPGAGFIVQFGQFQYTTLATAIAAIGREQFVVFPNLVENAILIGVLALNKSTTQLSNTTTAQFFRADKFGQIIGAQAGVSTTNLQDAYENSLQPQITIGSVSGTLQIKGNAVGTNVLQVLNTGGSATFTVNNEGGVTANTLNINSIAAGTIINNLAYDATGRIIIGAGGGGSSTFTGGTVTGPTYFLAGVSANSISAATYLGLPPDIYVTGGTFSPSSSTIIFTNRTGGTFNVTGVTTPFTGGTVTGATIFTSGLSANTFSANSITGVTGRFINLSATSITGITGRFTNLTADTISGTTAILSNITASTISVGTISATTYVNTPYWISGSSGIASIRTRNAGTVATGDYSVAMGTGTTASGFSSFAFGLETTAMTSALYSVVGGEFSSVSGISSFVFGSGSSANNNFTIVLGNGLSTISGNTTYVDRFNVNRLGTGNAVTLLGRDAQGFLVSATSSSSSSSFSGGTVTGATYFSNGLSANTISATTYLGLPTDVYVTGGTFSSSTSTIGFRNTTGGTFFVSGITVSSSGSVSSSTTININGVVQDLSTNREWVTSQASTGILTFGPMSANTTTSIKIGPNVGYIVDNETNPLIPTYTLVNYSGNSAVTVTTLTATSISHVFINSGGTPFFTTTLPTSQERKQSLYLGKIGHRTGGLINNIINNPDFITSPVSQLRDLILAIRYINNGAYPYANGTNLLFNITTGSVFGNGVNLANSRTIPDEIAVGPISTGTTFFYRTQTGGTASSTTLIDPTRYDNGGVVTLVGGTSSRSTLQYIFCVPGGGFVVQYGQTLYSNLSAAIAAVSRESFTIFPNLVGNSIIIGILAMRRDATDLSDVNQAQFFLADKFGQFIGATAGVTTASLQTAYNNSTQPQITTTPSLGAVQIRGNTSSSIILQGLSFTGGTTFNLNSQGDITGNTVFIRTVNIPTGTSITVQSPIAIQTSENTFTHYNIQNASTGTNAASEYALTSNIGTLTTNYFSFGINNSNYNNVQYSIYSGNTGYLLMNGANMYIGTETAHDVVFHTSGTTPSREIMRLTNSGLRISGALSANTLVYIPTLAAPSGSVIGLGINSSGLIVTGGSVVAASSENVKIPVRNQSGATILKGKAVFVSGASSNFATIGLALANTNVNTTMALGLVENDIPNNSNGYVVALGNINNLNTSAFLDGDKLYVSNTTAGDLITTPPISPNNVMFVGTVTSAHPSQGKILIDVLYSFKLETLVDVALSSPTNGQIIRYDFTNKLWVNSNLPSDSFITGGTFSSTTASSGGTITFSDSTGGTLTVSGLARPMLYYTEYSGAPSPPIATGFNSLAMGSSAKAPSAYNINIGENAGASQTTNQDSINIGRNTGAAGVGNNTTSISIGLYAGYNSNSSSNAINIGENAGLGHTTSINSVMLGSHAGDSNNYSGGSFTNRAPYSTYLGYNSGRINATNFSGFNNVVIGHNVGIPSGTSSTLNIGGVIWATGLYPIMTGYTSVSAQTIGKVGINLLNPAYELDVNGQIHTNGIARADNRVVSPWVGIDTDISWIFGGVNGIRAQRDPSSNRYVNSAGNQNIMTFNIPFSPSTGNATFSVLNISNEITQTGGASGITRGIFINPTITATSDFRAIEVVTGKTILQTVSATSITANTFVKSGGTSTQFLMADGSVSTGQSFTNYWAISGSSSAITNVNGGNVIIKGLDTGATDALQVITSANTVFVRLGNDKISSINSVKDSTSSLTIGPANAGGGNNYSLKLTDGTTTFAAFRAGVGIECATYGSLGASGTIVNGNQALNLNYVNPNNGNISMTSSGQFSVPLTNTSRNLVNVTLNLSPFSGSSALTLNTFSILPTINFSGGTTTLVRGLFISPTLSFLSGTNEYRAIEVTTGKTILDTLSANSLTANTALINAGLSAGTVSATTYLNLPAGSTSATLTGGTMSGNTLVLTNNSGQTVNVIGIVNTATTLTINGVVKTLNQNNEWLTSQASTGILNYGTGITASTSSSINIGPMSGYVVNNESDPFNPTFTLVTYSGNTSVPVTTLNTGIGSYVLLNSSGVPTFQNTFPTSTERKQNIWLGKIGHPLSAVTFVINEPDFITSPLSQFRDLFQSINYVNGGVYPYAHGTDLNFNITSGTITGKGLNLHNSNLNPDRIQVGPSIPASFLYRTQTGGTGTTTTLIEPSFSDVNGTKTAILGASTQATNQWIFVVPGAGLAVQYGQNIYTTLADAITNVGRETFIVFPNLVDNAILIGILSVTKGASDLSNTGQARFFRADKFGQIIGAAAGISTSTLQAAYDNSVQPQIVTSSTGALQLKGFSSSGNSLIQGLNSAGTVTFSVNEGGGLSATSITANTISATTYLNLPIKYYAEFSGAPSISPSVTATAGIAIGDGAQSRGTNQLSFGSNAGNNASGNTNTVSIGNSAGNVASGSTNTIYIGTQAGMSGYTNVNTVMIGNTAGYQSSGNSQSVMIGNRAGFSSTGSSASIFIGGNAGQFTNGSGNQIMIGASAGQNAAGALGNTIFIGAQAGQSGDSSSNSVFIGNNAGFQGVGSSTSVFIGQQTGQNSSACTGSIFFGLRAGSGATSVTNSILMGTNATLPNSTSNGLNIGGVLFGRGLISAGSTPLTGATSAGRIGINVPVPVEALDISGNTKMTGTLSATTVVVGSATSLHASARVTANTGTTIVYSIPTSTYNGSFIDYTVNNGSSLRAGTIMSIFNASNIRYTETSTTDIGNTSGITFSMAISGSNAVFQASAVTSGWDIKSIIRSI